MTRLQQRGDLKAIATVYHDTGVPGGMFYGAVAHPAWDVPEAAWRMVEEKVAADVARHFGYEA